MGWVRFDAAGRRLTAAGSAGGWRRPTDPALCAPERAVPLHTCGYQTHVSRAEAKAQPASLQLCSGGGFPSACCYSAPWPASPCRHLLWSPPVNLASTEPSAWIRTDVRSSTCWPAGTERRQARQAMQAGGEWRYVPALPSTHPPTHQPGLSTLISPPFSPLHPPLCRLMSPPAHASSTAGGAWSRGCRHCHCHWRASKQQQATTAVACRAHPRRPPLPQSFW